jgi:ribonuclease HI
MTEKSKITIVDDFWLLHADGASLGNPGHGGAGAIIYDPAGEVQAEISLYLGKVTNN